MCLGSSCWGKCKRGETGQPRMGLQGMMGGGDAGFQCSPPAVPCCPTACRLTAAERAATSAEETDIDAVELPLPGADILDFSRGVTDLDAVGKEASGDAKVCGSLWGSGGIL